MVQLTLKPDRASDIERGGKNKTTKIDTISGFLGAGKTTFIKKLLEEAVSGEQTVLIENEFGEIRIDGGFLKDSGIEIREMNSGCICCSLAGDFGISLAEVLTQYRPERIIIESSGAGKPSDVMKVVTDISADVDMGLSSAVTIADTAKCKMYIESLGEFFNNQIENTETIVLNCTNITDASKIQKDVEMIRKKNANVIIITTPLDRLDGSQLLEIIEKKGIMLDDLLAEVWESRRVHDHGKESFDHHRHGHDEEYCGHHDHGGECHDHHHGEECHDHHHGEKCHDHHHDGYGCGHDHHHHHAGEVFTDWGVEAIVPMTYEQLEDVLERLSSTRELGNVLRARGMLPTENLDEWLYFNLVPGQYEIRQGKPDYIDKVCVIGANLREEELNSVFGRDWLDRGKRIWLMR